MSTSPESSDQQDPIEALIARGDLSILVSDAAAQDLLQSMQKTAARRRVSLLHLVEHGYLRRFTPSPEAERLLSEIAGTDDSQWENVPDPNHISSQDLILIEASIRTAAALTRELASQVLQGKISDPSTSEPRDRTLIYLYRRRIGEAIQALVKTEALFREKASKANEAVDTYVNSINKLIVTLTFLYVFLDKFIH